MADKLRVGCIAAGAVLLLLLLEPTAVLSSMEEGLRLCARTVIPALFPYLVASELLVSSGAGERLAAVLAAPLRAVFGVSRCGAATYLMGLLCGFPVAARMGASYVSEGRMSAKEAQRLLCFANVPSAAFLINAVGVSLYGDLAFGRFLWLAAVGSAAFVGVLFRWLPPPAQPMEPLLPSSVGRPCESAPARAASSLLTVVSTVLFFGALRGATQAMLAHTLDGTQAWHALLRVLLAAFLEMTGGVAQAASLAQSQSAALCALSRPLCAAAIGWGGLSVHVQLLSSYRGRQSGGALWRFYIARLMQGALCTLAVMGYEYLH